MSKEQSYQVTYCLNRKLPPWARKQAPGPVLSPPHRRLGPRRVYWTKDSRKLHQAPEVEKVDRGGLAQLPKVLIRSLNISLNL